MKNRSQQVRTDLVRRVDQIGRKREWLGVVLTTSALFSVGAMAAPGDEDDDGIPDSVEAEIDRDGDGEPDYSFTTEPFFTEDFGTGSRTDSAFTNYTFQPNGDIFDGFYAVAQPTDVGGVWMNYGGELTEDFTEGDVDGRFFSVNGDFDPGEFYRRQITGLTAGASYLFSAWAINTKPDSEISPDLLFEIRDTSGTLLSEFETGAISEENVWTRGEMFFKSSDGADVELILINNAPGGLGNDLAIDDIEFLRVFNDRDGDEIADYLDTDSDNDLIPDSIEGVVDTDEDGTPDYLDLDSDGDGIPDTVEVGVDPANPLNSSGDGAFDFQSTDSDGDGIPDNVEAGANPLEPIDSDSDSIADYRDLDSDNDGALDEQETTVDSDSDGTGDYLDLDSDNDGLSDLIEVGVSLGMDSNGDGRLDGGFGDNGLADAIETAPDSGNTDYDGDGVADTPPDTDIDGTINRLDLDSDEDGISDLVEAGGIDEDNDARVDNFTDADGDGRDDSIALQGLPDADQDSDGDVNRLDVDSDGDGISDLIEAGLQDNRLRDTNNDGEPDYLDLDSDGDGISDEIEGNVDSDGDGDRDFRDLDSDNDGTPDADEDSNPDTGSGGNTGTDSGSGSGGDTGTDTGSGSGGDTGSGTDTDSTTDGDGSQGAMDTDSDNDGIPDLIEGDRDTDGDSVIDRLDLDSDNDGIPDSVEAGESPDMPVDTDNDGIADVRDRDSDNDGLTDTMETVGVQADTNRDGVVDGFADANGDGLDDGLAAIPADIRDTDEDGVPDFRDTDTDGDTVLDIVEAGLTDADNDGIVDTMSDIDNDGIPDSVDHDQTGGLDADNDGIQDTADSDFVTELDSDADGIIDSRDPDADGDGIADLFQDAGSNGFTPLPDVDGNGIPDVREVVDPVTSSARRTIRTGLQGGGCSIYAAKSGFGKDPVLPLLMMLSVVFLMLRRKKSVMPSALVRRTKPLSRAATPTARQPKFYVWSLPIVVAVAGSITAGSGDVQADESASQDAAERRAATVQPTSDTMSERDSHRLKRKIYAGIGLGRSWLEPDTSAVDGVDPNDRVQLGGQLMLGLDINKWVSAEIHAADLGSAGLSPSGEISYRQIGVSGLFYAGGNRHRYNRNGLTAFGRVGLGYLDNEGSDDIDFETDHPAHVLVGGGLEYSFINGLGIRAEAIVFDADVNYSQLSLLYRFGGRKNRDEKRTGVESGLASISRARSEAPDSIPAPDLIKEDATAAQSGSVATIATTIMDNDKDGVLDANDNCPDTTPGVLVDDNGCAVFDGVIEGLNFHSGSAELTNASMSILDDVADKLNAYPAARVVLAAHTDSQGEAQANLALSAQRAKSVARYLVNSGISVRRLSARAFGETQPIDTNETAAGRLRNRRVELQMLN